MASAKTKTMSATRLATGFLNSGWHTGLSKQAAQQNRYMCTDSEFYDYRIGVMFFDGLREAIMGTEIQSISITATFGKSGMHTTTKNVQFYTSKLDDYNSGLTAIKNSYLGTHCGTLTTLGYDLTATYTFSGSGLTTLANAFAAGQCALCIWNTDSTTSHINENKEGVPAGDIGNNYCAITEIIITVVYKERTVWVHNGTTWVETVPWVCNNNKWYRSIPWIYNGSAWK